MKAELINNIGRVVSGVLVLIIGQLLGIWS